ncbi:MAG: cell wall hydrolase [Lachnospiraceae bacterium]|nr:cell wall hydrolase [Lachnospiraceae bacterium]
MAYGESLSTANELIGRDGIDLLTRLIYAEALNQSESVKKGVAFVVKNRKEKNSSVFGGNTWEGVILEKNQFTKITSSYALQPDTSSEEWKTSLDIARNIADKTNPVGNCLWYAKSTYYARKVSTENGKEYYCQGTGVYNEVIEKTVLGDYTFYRLLGY